MQSGQDEIKKTMKILSCFLFAETSTSQDQPQEVIASSETNEELVTAKGSPSSNTFPGKILFFFMFKTYNMSIASDVSMHF